MSKATAEIRSLARSHTAAAVKTLAGIMRQPKAPAAARVAACKELLDRGWGKAPQAITGPGGGPIQTVDLTNATDEQIAALESLFGRLAVASGDAGGDQGRKSEAEVCITGRPEPSSPS